MSDEAMTCRNRIFWRERSQKLSHSPQCGGLSLSAIDMMLSHILCHLLDTYPDIRGTQGDRISVMVLDHMTTKPEA